MPRFIAFVILGPEPPGRVGLNPMPVVLAGPKWPAGDGGQLAASGTIQKPQRNWSITVTAFLCCFRQLQQPPGLLFVTFSWSQEKVRPGACVPCSTVYDIHARLAVLVAMLTHSASQTSQPSQCDSF